MKAVLMDIRFFVTAVLLVTALAGCGGGGGSSSDSSGGGSGGNPNPPPSPSPPPSPPPTIDVRINEAMSSNALFDDEDGDSPDWIELYNPSDTAVMLNGWYLTDDVDEPTKWQIESLSLASGAYQLIYASDKDRQQSTTYRSLISRSVQARYITPQNAPDADWIDIDFNDSGWAQGATGIGYGDGDDNTEVAAQTVSIYLRQTFFLSDASSLQELILDIDYDDAFVAYLNGVEVARSNIAGSPPDPDTYAFVNHEAMLYRGGETERFDLSSYIDLLQNGENVLAVQVHNVSDDSSDMSIIPFLSARYGNSTTDGRLLSNELNFNSSRIHTNFKISATDAETIYLINPDQELVDSLRVEDVPVNKSIGKNDDNQVVYYETPTPGEANSIKEFVGAVSSLPVFSHQGGQTASLQLSITGNSDGETIGYTTDGSLPNASSSALNGTINISENTVVRAALFKANHIPSEVVTRSFILEDVHELPIVTLVSAHENLFDINNGMYAEGTGANSDFPFFGANFWNDWEKPMHFSYYPNGNDLELAMDGGAKIFGGWSRGNPQRSFSFFARGRYGPKEIDYAFFNDREYQEFQSLVLRNSGQDWLRSMFRDALMTGLMEGSGVDVQAAQPTVVYLNGNYWGVYNLREKVNEHFIDSRHQIDKDILSIIEREGEQVYGDNRHFNDMMTFVERNDLSQAQAVNTLSDMLDIENFINYQVAQIYFDNHDWPGNNTKAWRVEGDKWRWIMFDTDFGFNNFPEWHQANSFDSLSFATNPSGPNWPNPPWSTLLLRKLLGNDGFKRRIINRFADEFNSRFRPENVESAINEHAKRYQSEMPKHFSRWVSEATNKGIQTRSWDLEVVRLKSFAQSRPNHMRRHIANYFDLGGHYQLRVLNEEAAGGAVVLNEHLKVQESDWTGRYFGNNSITLSPQAAAGYRFSHWIIDARVDATQIEMTLTQDTQVTAVFVAN